jgi:NO-binding membrane sensor protein with MHYT domain
VKGYYSPQLVALSLAIAILASYTALDLAGRVSQSLSTPRRAWLWLIAGALSMGTGIWAMHFIGMLAFHLPIPIAYDIFMTSLSMLVAVAVSATALFVLRQPQVATRNLLAGAGLMGTGIVAMHYSGMAAIRMFPPIRYDPALFGASVLIAVLASVAALWIALRVRTLSRFAMLAKLASAGVMGLAITGMRYTGMAAAQFAPGSVCLAVTTGGALSNTTLALIIGCIAFGIMSVTIILSTVDAHFAARNERLAGSLRLAKETAEAALRENERITAELRTTQGKLVSAARQAGMAEIATNVLHNVGNVLNSVTVSAGLIYDRLRESKLGGLAQSLELLREHTDRLGEFLTLDPRGVRVVPYLGKLAETLETERAAVLDEIEALTRSIEHVKDVVATQQSYSGAASLVEPVRLEKLVDDALRMGGLSVSSAVVSVVKDVGELPALLLDRHLILQILVNLITNARQAVQAAPGAHEIRIGIAVGGTPSMRRLQIFVSDDGDGIRPEDLRRLFTHGFTTRESGHGFGLHSSILAAQSMGGTLTAHSEGPGCGATFTLELPMKEAEKAA